MIPRILQPVVHRGSVPDAGFETTLSQLCNQAGIPVRASRPPRRIHVVLGEERQLRLPDADIVGIPGGLDPEGPEAALRALEALAHAFHDHAARACVCGRGLFGIPGARATRGP